jgi:hypothetical protein
MMLESKLMSFDSKNRILHSLAVIEMQLHPRPIIHSQTATLSYKIVALSTKPTLVSAEKFFSRYTKSIRDGNQAYSPFLKHRKEIKVSFPLPLIVRTTASGVWQ